MARNRMIKPEFWEDSKIAKLSDKAKLLFIAMWNFADDEGYLEGTEEWIKIKCFPYEKEIKISDFIEELLSKELIYLENGVIRIKNFLKHQKIKKPSASILKEKFETRLQEKEQVPKLFSSGGETVGKEFSTGGEPVPAPYYKLKEVKGKEDKEKLKEGKGSVKGKETKEPLVDNADNANSSNGVNDQTDISFAEKQGTAEDTETSRTGDEKPKPVNLGFLGATVSEETKSRGSAEGGNTAVKPSESPPEVNSWGSDIIRSTRVETYKARVEYGRSVGLEESEAKRIANFAQSEKIELSEAHYRGFVGKGKKEIEEGFKLLKTLAQRQKKFKGFRRINSS